MKKAKKENWEKKNRTDGKQTEIERESGKKKKLRFSRCSDDRSSTIREEKSIYASRATRGYQNLRVSSNSTR